MLLITTRFALFHLLRVVAARALWLPKELQLDSATWTPEDFTITKRADVCGGESDLSQCGTGFPSDFCCPAETICLSLNTTSTLTAALCCPAGQDCDTITPVSCDQTFQNATTNPGSQLHSKPTAKLNTCSDNCCPMGYKCSGSLCVAMTAGEATLSSSAASNTPSSTAGQSTPSASSGGSTASASSTSDAASSSDSVKDSEQNSDPFSSKSFAAGFIPGIVLGMLLMAAVLFFLLRRKHKKEGGISGKHRSKDTLTDLGPKAPSRRPTVHGRSISEPTVDMNLGHRTDFANHTPPEQKSRGAHDGLAGYVVSVDSPAPRPANPTPQGKSFLSRSPFVNQAASPRPTHSPIPAHMKRGTLSFDSYKISPVRGLKKQRSMHSLRRQSQLAPVHDPQRQHVARQDSTETIKVAMDTPGQNPSTAGSLPSATLKPHFAKLAPQTDSSRSWQTTYSARSHDRTPIEEEPDYSTPTRPGRNSHIQHIGASLQSPYTPSNYPSIMYDRRASIRTQPQVTYPPLPVKATSAPQPYPTPQSSEAHKSYIAPVSGHVSTFADTGMPFLRSPNLPSPSPAYVPENSNKAKSRLTGLFPGWGTRDEMPQDNRMTRASGQTTWGGMIEKAGLRRSQLYTREQGDPREWNR